jgi:RNA recognition motif-containing protein
MSRLKIIRDMFSQTSKGFGFVEMTGMAEAQKALDELNTFEFKGKKLNVNEAIPRGEKKAAEEDIDHNQLLYFML